MKVTDFQSFASHVGFKVVGTEAYGFMGQHPAYAFRNSNLVTIHLSFETCKDKAFQQSVKQALKGTVKHVLGNEILVLNFSGSLSQVLEKYEKVANELTPIFQNFRIVPPHNCAICKNSGCDSLAKQDTEYLPVHSSCIRKQMEETQEQAQDNKANGSYVTGIIGGLLGGIVACIPNLLTIWFLERISIYLYALIPLGIYCGYKLLKGRLSKGVIGYVVVLSVILAVGLDFAALALSLISEGFPLALIPAALQDSDFKEIMIVESIKSLVFVVVGIVITWSQIKKTSDDYISDVQCVIDSMVPYTQHTHVDHTNL